MRISTLRDALRDAGHRLVLAESCTAGNVAAQLGQLPGISEFFCGSMVVYRNASKAEWLGISRALLDDPTLGPVSAAVTLALAQSALQRTPEATLGAAITGHLGPGAPAGYDGCVYCAIVDREDPEYAAQRALRLLSAVPRDEGDLDARRVRQEEATGALIAFLIEWLAGQVPTSNVSGTA
jgi:PncC family amidohydrolase